MDNSGAEGGGCRLWAGGKHLSSSHKVTRLGSEDTMLTFIRTRETPRERKRAQRNCETQPSNAAVREQESMRAKDQCEQPMEERIMAAVEERLSANLSRQFQDEVALHLTSKVCSNIL